MKITVRLSCGCRIETPDSGIGISLGNQTELHANVNDLGVYPCMLHLGALGLGIGMMRASMREKFVSFTVDVPITELVKQPALPLEQPEPALPLEQPEPGGFYRRFDSHGRPIKVTVPDK